MEYAIHTLEIEIARIRKALRVAQSTNVSAADTQEGYPIHYQDLRKNIRELEEAIRVLKGWHEAQPPQEERF